MRETLRCYGKADRDNAGEIVESLKEYEDAVDALGLTDAELAKYQPEVVK